jgi:hypothetical protein
MTEKWKLVGYDTFEGEWYPIKEFDSKEEVMKAAREYAEGLDRDQPPESSGGQGTYGIQDRIYIATPDGNTYRYYW